MGFFIVAFIGLVSSPVAVRMLRGTITLTFGFEVISQLGIAAVAGVLIWKRPRNLVSWILVMLAVLGAAER